jgi:thioredoxin reductase (NADPH)
MSETLEPTPVEAVIIGAGPVGLFQIFELGLLGINAHIIDSLAQPGGQCTELYPEKPIYDIPAIPICGAQELIDRLLEQVKPFHATFHLGQEVTEVQPLPDGKILVATSAGTRLRAGAVVVAAGVGSFQPRRLVVPGIEQFEGKSVHYRVKTAAEFYGRDLVICGGGDSALDWTVALCEKARSLTLVHRRAEFRAAPATVARMRELVAAGKMRLIEGNAAAVQSEPHADGTAKLTGVVVQAHNGQTTSRLPPTKCSRSSVCIRNWVRSPNGDSSSRRRRSKWTPKNSRPACPGYSRSATSIRTRARRS